MKEKAGALTCRSKKFRIGWIAGGVRRVLRKEKIGYVGDEVPETGWKKGVVALYSCENRAYSVRLSNFDTIKTE